MNTTAFERQTVAVAAQKLAAEGVFLGTSSWKYRGWSGMLYDESRYVFRGRFAERRFEQHCLAEYAEVFRTVSVDATYYTFPMPALLAGLAAQVPEDFRFAFKVTDAITVKRFSNLPRFGTRAGQPNEHFLDAGRFAQAFLEPLMAVRSRVGPLILEFSRFHPDDYARGRDFVEDLDAFLGRLPAGWNYAVEIRNRQFLHPDYFACLARHRVAHVFSHWEQMPPAGEQMSMPGSRTADFTVARLLLKPGRPYQTAVDQFSPYTRIKEVNPEARSAGAALINAGKQAGFARPTYIYVNNRLEGNALLSIAAMMDLAAGGGSSQPLGNSDPPARPAETSNRALPLPPPS